jgi:hypothetical protein
MQANNIPFTVIKNASGAEETKEVAPIKAKDLLLILSKTNAWGSEKFKKLLQF